MGALSVVVSEVSIALVLLIGSGLLIRSLAALHAVDPGFDATNVLTLEMSLNGERFQQTEGVAELSQDGRARLNAMPGVEISAAGFWLPIYVADSAGVQIVGKQVDKDHQYGSRWLSISPAYLSAFKIPVLRGRGFNESDTENSPLVALINQTTAQRYWPGRNPIGQQIAINKGGGPGMDESTLTIVGVVGDTHIAGLGQPPGNLVIVPIAQVTDAYTRSYTNGQPLFWVVRTRGDPRQAIPVITEQLRIASGGLPVAHVRTMDEVMGTSTSRENFNMLLLTILGGVALVLAAIGIFGLMAYSVAQRSQELGVRMALGADRSAIRSFVVWNGMRLVVIGIIIGVAAALLLTHLIASLLFGVRPLDPAAFFFAPLILSAVALLAVWVPPRAPPRSTPCRPCAQSNEGRNWDRAAGSWQAPFEQVLDSDHWIDPEKCPIVSQFPASTRFSDRETQADKSVLINSSIWTVAMGVDRDLLDSQSAKTPILPAAWPTRMAFT